MKAFLLGLLGSVVGSVSILFMVYLFFLVLAGGSK